MKMKKTQLRRIFTTYDVNENGDISFEEFKKYDGRVGT